MKNLLVRLLTLTTVFAVSASAAFAAAGWEDDYDKALAKAKAEKKMVLLDFTGSDWCGWCVKLDKDIFSTTDFKDYAKDNLVLVELDFPRAKQQSEKLKEQNKKLKSEFAVKGFPTIVVLNSDGKEVGKIVGYTAGGPSAFIAKVNELKGK